MDLTAVKQILIDLYCKLGYFTTQRDFSMSQAVTQTINTIETLYQVKLTRTPSGDFKIE